MDSQNQSGYSKQLQEIQELRRQQYLKHKAAQQETKDESPKNSEQQNTTQQTAPQQINTVDTTPIQNVPTPTTPTSSEHITTEQKVDHDQEIQNNQNEIDDIPPPAESEILVKIASLGSPAKDIDVVIDPRAAPVALKKKILLLTGNRPDTIKLFHPTTTSPLEEHTPLYKQRVTNNMRLFCKYHPPGAKSNGKIEPRSCQLIRVFVKKRNLAILEPQTSKSTVPAVVALDKLIDEFQRDLLWLKTVPPSFPSQQVFEKAQYLLNKLQLLDEKKIIYMQNRGAIQPFTRYATISQVFGIFPGVVISTPKGDAVVVGVHENNLWFKAVADYGATYWNNIQDYASVCSVLKPKLLAWNGALRQESAFLDIMHSILSPFIQQRNNLLKEESTCQDVNTEDCNATQDNHPTLSIDDIPDHLMISHIFSGLDTFYERAVISRVCKKWNTLVNDESLWHHVDFSLQTQISSEIFSTFISKKGHCIRTLCVQGCRGLHDASWVTVAACCPNLEELNVCNTAFDNGAFADLAISCPNMKSLWLIDSLVTNEAFDVEAKWILKEVHLNCEEDEVADLLESLALNTVENFYFRQYETRGWIVIKHGELGKPHKINRDADQRLEDLKVMIHNLYGARTCDQLVPYMTNADIPVGDDEYITQSINPFSIWVVVTDQH